MLAVNDTGRNNTSIDSANPNDIPRGGYNTTEVPEDPDETHSANGAELSQQEWLSNCARRNQESLKGLRAGSLRH
ncbi:hypothetical protein MPH_01943 [Macrophomina phaseolina MS6]|uniref:Uncharacterized protein n=1 Tax=Macrophomina phaseolina (strain MS6) TaxID=1126212 RepID=K2RE17_MACPH|nr:hypothetical protein MPH_01943 [Macrophomina phaseolina MS6]